ncbi:MAG: AMP-binding protein, partial [Candidatus Omnitrophica bacterium]|nr:AMP-binding protein [Candidatus Omnitrophota bacterium]
KIIFCSENIFHEKLKPHKEKYPLKFVVVDNPNYPAQDIVSFSAIENITPETDLLPVVTPQDVVSLIYTSGTTGRPKGVLLTHKNICADFLSLKELNLCLPSDNVLSLLPLYHTYAFMVTLIVPLLMGAEITYALNFKPADLTSIIKEARVSFLVGVPQLFLLVHKAISDQLKKIPLFLRILLQPAINSRLRRRFGKNLRFLVSGGARLEPKIARDLARWLKVGLIEGYGLTETSPVVTLNPPRKIKFGSVGKPIPEVEIKILNPDKSGIGEVLIKGPNVMPGYFKREDLTAQVIKDGWFYSGDLGYLDKEGYLYLVGRQKEVIVLSSGKNIYPEELEEYYSQCPYIKEICIVSRKEERFGRPIESLSAHGFYRYQRRASAHGFKKD